MDYFSKNPIKITLISRRENNVLTEVLYIIVGDVPHTIKKEIKKKPKTSTILNKFYGHNWKKKLGFDISKTKSSSIGGGRGGGEEAEDDEITADTNETTNNVPPLVIEDDMDIEEVKDDTPVVKQKINWIFDVSVYSEDKISEFKQKLLLITSIPIYRQHVWYETNIINPLAYIIYKQDTKIHVDIKSMLKSLENNTNNLKIVENIPIDMDMYENKSEIKVVAYDGFRILSDFNTTHYKMIDCNDFIEPIKFKLEQMISPDKSKFDLTLEMIYYSFVLKYFPIITIPVFIQYIQNEHLIKDYFPELAPSSTQLRKIYDKQRQIIQEKNTINIKPIQLNIKSSIMAITLNVVHNILNIEMVHLRNLFDLFVTTPQINFIQTFLFHDSKRILLKKTYISFEERIEKVQENSILFRISLDVETRDHIDLIVYSNGNYKIKTTWREESKYNFKDVFTLTLELITPIINEINSFGAMVLRHNKIPHMNWNNVTFTDISVSLFYKCDTSDDDFEIFKNLFTRLEQANIVEQRSIERNSMNYYFLKGMYKFDPMRIEKIISLNNYYAHMSDSAIKIKWESIFIKCRIVRILKRFSGIKFDINGIKKVEYDIFLKYIFYVLHHFTEYKKTKKSTIQKVKVVKKLASLKEQDPVLYSFKKKYGSRIIYSKICQKPFQPLLLTWTNFNRLTKNEKNRVLKWKNITTNEDAYYFCPNPSFPFVRFKIGKHPKGYGIPCCQKTNISTNINDPNRIIHNKILKNLIYLEEKKLKVSSRYIMTYGKDIEPGRLSKLPENTLERLFYEEVLVIDDDCIKNTGYYLVGVPQHSPNANAVGYMFCLADVLDMELTDMLIMLIKLLKKHPQMFYVLLVGKITKYFPTVDDFIDKLKIFLNSSSFIISFDWWNTIFIDIAKYYFKINTIVFEDFASTNEIVLTIPPYINYSDDYMNQNYESIIVVKRHKIFHTKDIPVCYYYPIYMVNKEIYFKTKIVEKKLYSYNSPPIINIQSIVISELEQSQNKLNCIDLNIVKKFITFTQEKYSKKYTINLLYINKQNLCYTVRLIQNKQYLNIPIKPSPYKLEGYALSFKPYLRSIHPTTISTLITFIKEYNKWVNYELSSVRDEVNITIYPNISIVNWIEYVPSLGKSGVVIGLISNELSFYFSSITKVKATRIKKVKFIPLLYSLDKVNMAIFNNISPVLDRRCKEIGKSIYKNNLYQLFVLEFMTAFNKETNVKLRKEIYSIISKYSRDLGKIIQNIQEVISKYYDKDSNEVVEDQRKIIQQLRLATFQKVNLTNDIKTSHYNFDRITINKLIKMNHNDIVIELKKIAKKIISIKPISNSKNFLFPNIYVSCVNYYKLAKQSPREPISYCHNTKLIMEKTKLNEYIQLFAGDIIDPLKFKYIFGLIQMDNVVDYFKFVRRPTEVIKIIVG